MYTHQPGIHVKYAPVSGKNTHFSQKYETKNLELRYHLTVFVIAPFLFNSLASSDNNTSFTIGGFTVKRDATGNNYKLTMDDKDCPIKGEVEFSSEGRKGIKFGDVRIHSFSLSCICLVFCAMCARGC
jgi:hypothetical protein